MPEDKSDGMNEWHNMIDLFFMHCDINKLYLIKEILTWLNIPALSL